METGNGKARVTVTLGVGAVVWAVACSGGPQGGGWFHGSSGGGSSGGEGDSGYGDDSGSSSGFGGSSSGFGGSSGGSSGSSSGFSGSSSGGPVGTYVVGTSATYVGQGSPAGDVAGCGSTCACTDVGKLYCGYCGSTNLCIYCPSGSYCPSDPCTTATTCPTATSDGYVCPASTPSLCTTTTQFCCPTGYTVCCTTGAYCATDGSACPP
jgi:hypothetical protein